MARKTSFEDRTRILAWAEAGLTDHQIAQGMHLSFYTVRKWRRRARKGDPLTWSMGRPASGVMSSFAALVREEILLQRNRHPGWGAKTLRAHLQREMPEANAPSVATIGRLLKQRTLVRPYQRHHELPQPTPRSVDRPHQRWQMDAQGNESIPKVGTVALINLSDTVSRLRLLSFPCPVGSPQGHPTTEDYQSALRLAFSHWGLPEELQVDHESIFVDRTSKSPYPTRLHLWLLALGVDLVFSHGPPPNEQAMIERSHQLWYSQVVEGQCFADWSNLFEALLERRTFLNEHLPCASLGERTPLEAYPKARHSGRFYRPERESALLAMSRVEAYLSQGCWYRWVSKDATLRLGGHVYYVGTGLERTELAIRYEAQHMLFHNEAGEEVARKPIKGLDPKSLMGNMILPSFQLQLPFAWEDQRGGRLFEQMGV